MGSFQINLLPFSILKDEVDIFFSSEEKNSYRRLFKDQLPKDIPQYFKIPLDKFAWWSIQQGKDDCLVRVNLHENLSFTKVYFNELIFQHFSKNNFIISRNFIKDTEVFLEDFSNEYREYKKYKRFSLRIDTNALIEGASLLLSYDGDSYVLNKSLAELGLDISLLGRVKFGNQITKFKFLSDDEKDRIADIFPILNRKIEMELGLMKPARNYSENKYKKYYENISEFYSKHLKDVIIDDCIKIYESGFYKPYDEIIGKTTEDSNLLLFGNNRRHFNTYIGIKENGPILPPSSEKSIRLIFIFNDEDKVYANKLYSYLKKGYKSFPGLESFVKIRFDIDAKRSIRFLEKDPIPEVKTALSMLEFDAEEYSYAAFYISRIRKDTFDENERNIYFRLKELLLKNNITSQVIFKENIDSPSFNYFLPNIAIALLAKLGGVPWRLYRPIKNDLVVGIGADRSLSSEERFVGCAFCFRNDGKFREFNAFEQNDLASLAISIKKAIQEYTEDNKGVDRLVIHYYKTMSDKEQKPIIHVLNELNLSIPYVIVTVNDTESKDYVLFDNSFDGKMPQSGVFLKVKWNEFILCNNTRYSISTGTRIEGFPFPIKIKFKSGNYEKNIEIAVIKELIDQVYQFSRMYWKSVRQRNMPVTIEYSKIVAEMVAHFEDKELGDFTRTSLWFL